MYVWGSSDGWLDTLNFCLPMMAVLGLCRFLRETHFKVCLSTWSKAADDAVRKIVDRTPAAHASSACMGVMYDAHAPYAYDMVFKPVKWTTSIR